MSEIIDQIKALPKRKPLDFGKRSAAGELVSIHIWQRRVYGKKIPTYTARSKRGRKMAQRWCMRRVPWVFTDWALKAEGLK